MRPMTDSVLAIRHPTPNLVHSLDVGAKAGLLLLLAAALLYPDLGHMRGKAAGLRAIAYPMLAFTVPVIWWLSWRERASFPWAADLLVTITCFTDVLGNRMNMYDTVVWFDDWMHFMNTGLLTAAVILLTMHRTSPFAALLERALAFGVTAAVAWEIAEYFAFIADSSERNGAYTDTLGDLGLGSLGAITAAAAIRALWQNGKLSSTAPQLESRVPAR
jgi:hypothetical protein